jgi:two-component system chemotaxis response regulator CheY
MSYNVLIVDDSPIIRAMVKKSLAMSGLDLSNVYEAENGVEALKKLEDEWIDIVLADLNMPKMGGFEMVQKMSEDSMLISTPVVIVSSDRNAEKMEQLKAAGIRAYIKKPFKPEQLRDVITDVMNSKLTGETNE